MHRKRAKRKTWFSKRKIAQISSTASQKEITPLEMRRTQPFYVYVYDFQPPLWIIISFSQHPKLDLLQFFITFSTCFLALLLIAAILWKIKQKYDRYRRRQRLYVEMEQMASRPFGQVLTELERIPDSESSHQHTRKRKLSEHSFSHQNQ